MDEPDGLRTAPGGLESTAVLLGQVREGDAAATERLIERFITPLQKIARRLLPRSGRDLADTDDLVFTTLHSALRVVKAGNFEARGEGAFLAYLRQCLHNAVHDEKMRKRRRPHSEELSSEVPDPAPSPLLEAIGRQDLRLFEKALASLTERTRHAVILRIEFGYTYEEIASAVGFPTASAARMQVARSLLRLARFLDGR